ncbi:MAG TPA: tRNA (adenine-N1)-methyltransferase, partial [Thermoplasmata archaeon]|nr:tRNA (adenine-N1)-methyltransferase [Thermoplasmata archaeon]
LRRSERDSILLRLRPGPVVLEGRGVIDLGNQIGRAPGGEITWAGASYRLLRPSLSDLIAHLRRVAQIVTPKDAQHLLYLAGVGPGDRVAEAGAGTGALTIFLAYSVGATGRVVSYDRRPEFLAVARENVAAAGLSDRVEFVERDVATSGLDRGGLDAVLLDLAEPWAVLRPAWEALGPGGRVATYTPTYNQLERTVQEMRAIGFEEVHSVEILERALHVGSGGTRPDFDMLGHTGFLSTGRRVAGPW